MNIKQNQNIKSFLIFISIFIYFLISLYIYVPLFKNSDHYIFTSYSLSFDQGINSRFLIGSILQFFTKTVSYESIRIFVLFFMLVLIIVTSLVITRIIEKAFISKNSLIILLCITFLVFPASITYLFNYANFARLDLYWVLIVFVILLFSLNKSIHYFISPLMLIGIATHQGFVFTYFPFVLVIQLYYFIMKKSDKFYFWNLFVSIIVTICSFIYFQLLIPEIQNFDLFLYNLQLKTEFDIHKEMLVYEYIFTLKDHFWQFWRPNIKVLFIRTLYTLPILVPSCMFFSTLWFNLYKRSEKLKFFYIFLLITPLFAIPLFLLTIDWGRWYAASLNVQFLSLIFLLYIEDKEVIEYFDFLNLKWSNLLFFIPIYFLCFNKFISLGIIDKLDPISKLVQIYERFLN